MKQELHHIQAPPNSRWVTQLGLFYLLGIFGLSLLCYHTGLLDYTLLPRNAAASLVVLCTTIFISIKSLGKLTTIHWPAMDLATGLLMSYVVWSTISVLWATNFSEAIFESQKAMLGFAAFYFCRWFQLNDEHFVSRLLKGMMVLTVPILLFACYQIVQLDPGIDKAQYQIRGISGHKNLFSTVLFLLAGFMSIAFFELKNHWRKVAALLFVSLLFLIIYLKTRSTYLGVIAVIGLFGFNKLSRRWRPGLASVVSRILVVLTVLGIIGFVNLLQTNQLIHFLRAFKVDELWQSDTGYERIMLWEKTACVIRQTPFVGIGAGNWQIEYPNCNVHGLYSVETDYTTFQRPHNDWLWVWAETGIVGLFCYLGFFLAILRVGFSNLKNEIFDVSHLAALARLSFMVGFMVIAFFSFPKERIEILLLIYTLVGLLYPRSLPKNIGYPFISKLILVLIIMSTSLHLFVSSHRMIGEKYIKEVLLYKQQQKWPELINSSDAALSRWYTIDPTSIPIHWYRGTANFVQGKYETALDDFLEAEKYAPYNHYLKNDLGSCYTKMGLKAKARDYYIEAIRISPLFDDPRVNIGVSYYNEGQYVEALDWINSIGNHDMKMKYRKIITDKLNSK